MSIVFSGELYDEVLRTAVFGKIRLGADSVAVLQVAGDPEEESSLRRGTRTLTFLDRHLQVTLKAGRVVHFGLYFRGKPRLSISLQNLELSNAASADEIRSWMRSVGMVWEEDERGYGMRMQLGSGIVLVSDEEGRLDSLQVS